MVNNRLFFFIYVISFIALTIPPFKILTLNSFLISSHNLGAVLIFFLMIVSFLILKNKIKTVNKNEKFNSMLILLYFLALSLSVIQALNTESFITNYKNILLGLMTYFVTINFFNSNHNNTELIIEKLFIIGAWISVIIQFLIYYLSPEKYSLLNVFLHPKYINLIIIDSQRNRYFIDFFYFSTIPIFIAILNKYGISKKKFSLILVLSLLFLATVSNFRTIIVVTVVSILVGIRYIKVNKFVILVSLFFLLIIFRSFSLNLTNNSSVDRLFSNEKIDRNSIIGRFELWGKAWDLAQQFPVFGVGLGNYFDNISKKFVNFSISNWPLEQTKLTLIDPHNMFLKLLAETGIIGAITYFSLQINFFIKDYKRYSLVNNLHKNLIQSFWILSLYTLVSPVSIIQFQVLYWGLRAFIDLLYNKK